MSHVDDGTLHTYLDGELAPAEARGVDAHVAQCPACRERLEEERALITRAGELLALAAPPDRELPPFRAGDVRPPTRLWWRVRLPLAWAATIVLALGIGTYLGRGVEQGRRAETPADTAPARLRALEAPIRPEQAQRESRVAARGTGRKPAAAPPAVPAQPTTDRADDVARQRHAQVPAQGLVRLDGERDVLKGSPIGVHTARALLGGDPLAVPGAPIRAVYRARELGYSAVVIVEQVLDSNTVIEVVNRRRSPMALDQVVVTAAPAARADSVSAPERAVPSRARVADSLAAAPAERAAARLSRRFANLEIQISGPVSSDSLRKLLELVQPLKP